LLLPAAAARTIRLRCTTPCGVEGDRTNWFSAAFIVASREIAGATLGMTPTVAQNPDNINDYLDDVLVAAIAALHPKFSAIPDIAKAAAGSPPVAGG